MIGTARRNQVVDPVDWRKGRNCDDGKPLWGVRRTECSTRLGDPGSRPPGTASATSSCGESAGSACCAGSACSSGGESSGSACTASPSCTACCAGSAGSAGGESAGSASPSCTACCGAGSSGGESAGSARPAGRWSARPAVNANSGPHGTELRGSGVPGFRDSYGCSDRPSGSCLLYTSPSPRDATLSRMPSSA